MSPNTADVSDNSLHYGISCDCTAHWALVFSLIFLPDSLDLAASRGPACETRIVPPQAHSVMKGSSPSPVLRQIVKQLAGHSRAPRADTRAGKRVNPSPRGIHCKSGARSEPERHGGIHAHSAPCPCTDCITHPGWRARKCVHGHNSLCCALGSVPAKLNLEVGSSLTMISRFVLKRFGLFRSF